MGFWFRSPKSIPTNLLDPFTAISGPGRQSEVGLEVGETTSVPFSNAGSKRVGDSLGSPFSLRQVSEATHLDVVASDKYAIAVKTTIPNSVGSLPKESSDVPLEAAVETAVPATQVIESLPAKDDWAKLFKGSSQLSKKGEGFTLPSGETCVKIPNSIIEKHQKASESFIIGQFYVDPPPQGTIHKIVNGI